MSERAPAERAGPLRVALVVGGTLLTVVLVALLTGKLLQRAHDEALARQAAVGARQLEASHQRETAVTQRLLQHVCTRDIDATLVRETARFDDARALAPVLGADVWLIAERAHELTRVAATAEYATALPSRAALERASRGPVSFVGSVPLVLMSCARQQGDALLWLVRVEPLSALTAHLSPPPPLRALSALDAARAHTDEHADAPALRIEGVDGAPAFTLWVRAQEPPSLAALAAFAPLMLLVLVLVGLLTYFVARRGVDDSVLAELERAATRVAAGDLSGRIARRTGGRADQTFHTFDRMTAELEEMRNRLADAERIAAWQDMARRIAHEIKNPLSPIQLAIETLRKAHHKRLPVFDEIFEESTRAILEEVRRMEHIVREFSEFARLPRARPGALALSALIAETVALYQPDDVALRVHESDDPFAIRADREQLTQVLVNLLQNAIDAARAAPSPCVEVTLARDAGEVLIHIDDNGPGIAPEERERVFEPYVTSKPSGTGLGLAIVRRIVSDHHGKVHASASPLGGARLTVRLP